MAGPGGESLGYSDSMRASSTNMIGVSSRTGYTRWHVEHFNPSPSRFSLTGVLHLGQTRISSSSWETAMEADPHRDSSRPRFVRATRPMEELCEGRNFQDQPPGPHFARGKLDRPDCQDLRTLVDPLESFFGFGNGVNRSDPEFAGFGCFNDHRNFLPFIGHAERRCGSRGTPAKLVPLPRGFKITVGHVGSE